MSNKETVATQNQNRINLRFAEIVHSRINHENMYMNTFLSRMELDIETGNRLLQGELDWPGTITFKQLDKCFGGTPGYWKGVYDNCKGLYTDQPLYKYELESPKMGKLTKPFVTCPVITAVNIKDIEYVQNPLSTITTEDTKLTRSIKDGLKFTNLELPAILPAAIILSGIKQGIVGIRLPEMGTVEEHEFLTSLFYLNQPARLEQQVVVLPALTTKWFNVNNKEQMDALARRVERDKLDGVRYNRVFIALYNDSYPDKVKEAHDVWIEATSYTESTVFLYNKNKGK